MDKNGIKIIKTLNKHGFIAYFAGGCVRDMIMGNKSKDYDIATDAHPNDIINIFPKTIPVGVQLTSKYLKWGHTGDFYEFKRSKKNAGKRTKNSK